MEPSLEPVEIRVLGCLIEKQITTPEYYPLTLNALVNACNQTTNRDPVTHYDESMVERGLERLREKALVWFVRGGRAVKYEHRFAEKSQRSRAELAVLCVLMLRGPQTAGEIRARTGRLHEFGGLEEVDRTLESLMTAEPPMVTKLPRSPGAKENRFTQLLGGEPRSTDAELRIGETPVREEASAVPSMDDSRVSQLADEVRALRQELQELREAFADLKQQLEGVGARQES